MLILSRKPEQSIIIDGQITITVIRLEGDNVKIGINAPRNISIMRGEIVDTVKQSNKNAAAITAGIDKKEIIASLRREPQDAGSPQ